MSSKCCIIGAVCPETNDPHKPKYCPHWVDNIAETNTDGSGRFTPSIYRGCFLARLPQYLVSIAAGAGHAAASYDKASNVISSSNENIAAVLQLGMAAYAGGLQKQIVVDNSATKGADN